MATTDLISLEDAKTSLRIKASDTTRDDQLQRCITAVSDRFDHELIGPTVHRSVSVTLPTRGLPWVDVGGPVAEWGAIVEWASASTSTSLAVEAPGSVPSAGVHARPYGPEPSLYSGELQRRASGRSSAFPGSGWVTISCTAGRVASTAEVPERIAEAATLTLRNAWRSYEITVGRSGDGGEYSVPRQGFPGFAVPRAAEEMVWNLLRSETGLR